MGEQWRFDQDEHEQWHWTRVQDDREPTESAVAFRTPVDCYLDAIRHAVGRRLTLSEAGAVTASGNPDSQPH